MIARRKTAVVVLAAGKGTRMKSDLPKVLHPLAGRPMIRYLIDTVETLAPERVIIVIGPEMEGVARAVAPHDTVVQHRRLGTGYAVATARDLLRGFDGDVLVLYGDTPLLSRATLENMLAVLRADSRIGLVVLGFRPSDPAEYGRLVTASDGSLIAIIEYRDATPSQRTIDLCNSGVMAVRGEHLFGLLDRIGNDNAKGEYYLTDIVALAQGFQCAHVEGNEVELFGINTRRDLARAEARVQEHLRNAMLDAGVTLIDPPTVHFCFDTHIGRDVTIHPYVVFGPSVTIGDGTVIYSFCHCEQVTIAIGASIGPYARLRPGAIIGAGAHVGNFVEVKKAVIEPGAKVNHLSYIGDGRVGAGANIGAGTIFCNYDGYAKSFTDVGAGAFIGSNSALVAPVRIGDGAVVGAGSVITKDVSAHALAVARGTQMEMPDWARLHWARKEAEKAGEKTERTQD
ncbi:MAG: bifunctional UDP-N-acetylglucosamine pyrophosphorylase / Glucosamine-1-phosphate N-acetyltransferase [Rhodospirillaceae bacterium]|nr:MAG: bifunctional UDP-N-acetylglucosamine pyrophosphorylase / Glucosamine-1-phosphate N-acetyltransferase [Rhodospirillaceae bacterium]